MSMWKIKKTLKICSPKTQTLVDASRRILYNDPSMRFSINPSQTKKFLTTKSGKVSIFSLPKFQKITGINVERLPHSIKVLLESALRNCDNYQVTTEDIRRLANWSPQQTQSAEIAFKPARVILQDFTGVPCVVDLAAMRSAMKRMGGDYKKINPQVPCDLVIDHSIQVDAFASKDALKINTAKEFERNKERYEFLKWGQKAFKNFRVVPPATGIVHQVNLEYIAQGVFRKKQGSETIAFPDSLVGTDSHTPMINGLGIVGWGVGGIEAEAVMLGEPIYMVMPEVIGFKLIGQLAEGLTATDLVLTVTNILRAKGVVEKFVEFFGEGLKTLSLPDRATIANMSPEYGATIGLFPVDEESLRYYRNTGRPSSQVDLIERYMKEQGMFYSQKSPQPFFTEVLELNLEKVEPSMAGPKRPQDRVSLSQVKHVFKTLLETPVNQHGFGLEKNTLENSAVIADGVQAKLTHGSVVIAAITSCTNTSNPSVLIGAGLLAKKAAERGLQTKNYVKTSFAPGSRAVTEYLKDAGLMPYLEKLGFYLVGYGCTTCIGNSGPLPEKISKAIQEANLVAVSVLSGNRNFEGRINPHTTASFLASPPLVIAYALTGTVNIDLTQESIGKDKNGEDVFLRDIWPTQSEINKIITKVVTAKRFKLSYKTVLKGDQNWNAIKAPKSDLYDWKEKSTYIQEPPYFIGMKEKQDSIREIKGARILVIAGDSVTTDHISPAGAIAISSPGGRYLEELGVAPKDFNSYGSRRGNDRIMTRGTFANIRFRNLLAPDTEGPWTIFLPENKKMSIYDASLLYRKSNTPLGILAGKEYGSGSSRDWAAKGPALLGIQFVIAESYERIHRSNLVGMGVLPLQFKDGENRQTLGLQGNEIFDFLGLNENLKPKQDISVIATSSDGSRKEFKTTARIDTPVEVDYYRNCGILQTVLRKLAK